MTDLSKNSLPEMGADLSLDDLDKVSGGSADGNALQAYYDCFVSLGLADEARRLLPQGKKAVVSYIMESMTRYAPPEISSQNKYCAQKVYGML